MENVSRIVLRDGNFLNITPLELEYLISIDAVGNALGFECVKSDVGDEKVHKELDKFRSFDFSFQTMSLDDFNSTYDSAIQPYWDLNEIGEHFEDIRLNYFSCSFTACDVLNDIIEDYSKDDAKRLDLIEIKQSNRSIFVAID